MKYGIFSDIHANTEAFDVVLKALEQNGVDELICCGDIVGYNASPDECVTTIINLGVRAVMGNHDKALIDPAEERLFNQYGLAAIRWQRSQVTPSHQNYLSQLPLRLKITGQSTQETFQVAHGSLDTQAPFEYISSPMEALRMTEIMSTDLCFIGHSHIAGIFSVDSDGDVEYYRASYGIEMVLEPAKKYIVNVGSVGQPRDRNPQASFCIYDTSTRKISIHRVDYNIESTITKVTKAGLPLFLADRLRIGW